MNKNEAADNLIMFARKVAKEYSTLTGEEGVFTFTCPLCSEEGRVAIVTCTIAPNGHVHGKCNGFNCIMWME